MKKAIRETKFVLFQHKLPKGYVCAFLDLNQLTRENNAYANKTYVYTYDKNGNILTKKTYAYTT